MAHRPLGVGRWLEDGLWEQRRRRFETTVADGRTAIRDDRDGRGEGREGDGNVPIAPMAQDHITTGSRCTLPTSRGDSVACHLTSPGCFQRPRQREPRNFSQRVSVHACTGGWQKGCLLERGTPPRLIYTLSLASVGGVLLRVANRAGWSGFGCWGGVGSAADGFQSADSGRRDCM